MRLKRGCSRCFRASAGHLNGMAWSPDSRLLAISGWVTAIRIWDATLGTCLANVAATRITLTYQSIPLGGARMASIWPLRAAGRGIHVWEVATGDQVWVNPYAVPRLRSCRLESGWEATGQLWR